MLNENRLVLDSEQDLKLCVKGTKIVYSRGVGSVGFSMQPTEETVVELRRVTESGDTEKLYVTKPLMTKLKALFDVAGRK